MPLMDEFREEREAMKHKTPKEKLSYFWDYYKWHVIVSILVLIVGISLIYETVTRKDVAFYALLLNGATYSFMQDNAENTSDFAAYAGIDENDYEILYDTTVQLGQGSANEYEAAQKLMVYIAAGDLDVMVSDYSSLEKYAYKENFHDMRTFLTQEQIEKYGASFYYIDNAVVREIDAANDAMNLDYVPNYGNPTQPEKMKEPIPVGIYLPKESPLLKDYYFHGEDVVVSVLINTSRPEITSQYIDFLMQQ